MDEDGELKQLSQLLHYHQQHSCEVFTDRGIYYLIKLDSKSRDQLCPLLAIVTIETESRVKYVSLLNNLNESRPLLAGLYLVSCYQTLFTQGTHDRLLYS